MGSSTVFDSLFDTLQLVLRVRYAQLLSLTTRSQLLKEVESNLP
jgi:hypothetical protein